MPFRNNAFSFIYTGGVLEHIKDIQGAVNEIYRCLVPRGFTTNTVPHTSLITPYRMIRWGNIPDVPVLRDILEFMEIGVLKGKRMRFGYEKSFTLRKIKSIFSNVGFKNVEAGLFKTYYPLEAVPYGSLKRIITTTANSSRFFWPMIYVNGEK
jgi:ubiquinone/menaquinone biosynthesis C-methylase UbiE